MKRAKVQPRNAALRFAFLVVLCLIVAVAPTGVSSGRTRRFGEKTKLSLQSGRPLADEVRALEGACGCVITYEDPFYVHPGEIDDVTESVRRDLDKYKPGEAPRVLVPKGGAFDFEYDSQLLLNDPERVVRDLVAAYASKLNAGTFRVQRNGRIIHVIPTAFKNLRGALTTQPVVLDAIISPPSLTRSSYQILREICSEVSRVTGTRVVVGGVPLNRLASYQEPIESKPQKARNLLEKMFGSGLSWQLFYGPGTKMYVLNVHTIR